LIKCHIVVTSGELPTIDTGHNQGGSDARLYLLGTESIVLTNMADIATRNAAKMPNGRLLLRNHSANLCLMLHSDCLSMIECSTSQKTFAVGTCTRTTTDSVCYGSSSWWQTRHGNHG